MLSYIAYLAIQSGPYIVTILIGSLIGSTFLKESFSGVAARVIGGAVAIFLPVVGSFLGNSGGDGSLMGVIPIASIFITISCVLGWLLYELILLLVRSKGSIVAVGTEWAANVALIIPMAYVYRSLRVSPNEFVAGFVILLLAATTVAFVVGCSYAFAKQNYSYKLGLENKDSYRIAFEELSRQELDVGLWAQCLAKANGNESIAKANYLKKRAADLAKSVPVQIGDTNL